LELGIAATSLGGGFFGGIVIGYAIKKIAKIIAVIVGSFLASLAYLQYQSNSKCKLGQITGCNTISSTK
jgi:uncharacterized membrane protein (Fun14 family)